MHADRTKNYLKSIGLDYEELYEELEEEGSFNGSKERLWRPVEGVYEDTQENEEERK